MAFLVEDGTGLAGANSYISVTEADAYFAEREYTNTPATTTWRLSTLPAVKQALLVQATQFLDGRYRSRWRGCRKLSTQALDWPRFDAYDDNGFQLSGVPGALKAATCELALRAMAAQLNPDQDRGGQVLRTVVGPIEVEYAPGAPAGLTYRQVDELLGRLLKAGMVRISRV